MGWQHGEGRHGATQIEPQEAAAATVQSSSEALRDWLGCGWALSRDVYAKVFEKKRGWVAWCSGKRRTMPRALLTLCSANGDGLTPPPSTLDTVVVFPCVQVMQKPLDGRVKTREDAPWRGVSFSPFVMLTCRRGARRGSGNHRDQRQAGPRSWTRSHPANTLQKLDPPPPIAQAGEVRRGAGAGHTGDRHLKSVLGLLGSLARLLFCLGRSVAQPIHTASPAPVCFTRFIWLSPSCELPERGVFFAKKLTYSH